MRLGDEICSSYGNMPKGHFPRGRGAGGHLPYLLYIRHFRDEQETGSSSTSWQARASLETIPERIAIYISAPDSYAFLSDELYLLSVFLLAESLQSILEISATYR